MQNNNNILQRLNSSNNEKDLSLRPGDFLDFVGQKKTIERLKIMTSAARQRGDALSHILFSGPPGVGKTTLAMILGHEMKTNVKITSAPVIEKPGDLAGMLTGLEHADILFIDEIHRLPRVIEEYLYSAMEDFRIDIMIDQGPNARSVSLSIPKFTLVGATTRTGLLSAPLRSRFTLQSRLDYYSIDDLCAIIKRSAKLFNIQVKDDCAVEIASRSRGTPRIANNLLRFVRDFAQQKSVNIIDCNIAYSALELLEIDKDGLDDLDKKILSTMAEFYHGGPVGLGTIAIAVGEEVQNLEEVHEPYLIQEGYLQRTQQGRVLTSKGWQKVGIKGVQNENLF